MVPRLAASGAAVLLLLPMGLPAGAAFMLRAGGADPTPAILFDFNGAVTRASCYGVWSNQALEGNLAHVAFRADGGLDLPGGVANDQASPIAAELLIEFAFFVLGVIVQPNPPEPKDEYWKYNCKVTDAWIDVWGRFGTLRRVSIEAHDTVAKEYKEVGAPCEYTGLPDHQDCRAFYQQAEQAFTGLEQGKNERPDWGEVCFDSDIRAVNAGQHRALEEAPVVGEKAVYDPNPVFSCRSPVPVSWCHVDTATCAPVEV